MSLNVATLYENFTPVWIELTFMCCFAMGFILLRLDFIPRTWIFGKSRGVKKASSQLSPALRGQDLLQKQIETEAGAGHFASALVTWRRSKNQVPANLESLRIVVQALLECEPASLVEEVIQHVELHQATLGNLRTATGVLDIVARSGQADVMEELATKFQSRVRVRATYQMNEVLLGGYALAGKEDKVRQLSEQIVEQRQKLSARGYSLTIKGFLKNGMADAALHQILEMCTHGFYVPSFAVTQLFRLACESGRSREMLDKMSSVVLPADAVVVLLEDCLKRSDVELARRVEQVAKDAKISLLTGCYDALLKLYAAAADSHALELFEAMQRANLRISEGLCVGLLARCANAKFLPFAEEIVKYCRAHSGMSISVYSALMKVYAYSGMYSKACDLYGEIREEGLEPDAMMYGCLMKFSVECGRTELSQELFEKTPSLDIQNYMSLIRAAGRDKNVERAFAVLDRLKRSGMTIDIAAYNCVIDVCVTSGDMKRARELVSELAQVGPLDLITYNTLLKGYVANSDVRGAREVLAEMEANGHKPNDVSYNCLINAAVSSGNLEEAWRSIETMERKQIKIDHYTVSTMMKAMKYTKNPREIGRTLALLDRCAINVCMDEVLLNSVLETCIRHREYRRLEKILESYARSPLRPSVPTYGSLIKACSTLRRFTRCQELWEEMTEKNRLPPNDVVLGCILDAYVVNGHVEEAVLLFRTWKVKVPANTVMYSTLIKGFANGRQNLRAMELWREMRTDRVDLNTVAYNAAIDAQARVGAMDQVGILVEAMSEDKIPPDAITHSTIIKGYCMSGNLDKAIELFQCSQRSDRTADSVIYNTILNGCIRHNRMELADALLENMDSYQIAPSNFTLGILVKLWGRRRQLDKAFKAYAEMPKKYGFTPNVEVKTCLMSACLSNREVDRAFAVFEELKVSGGADCKAYSSIVAGAVRAHRLEDAARLVEEAYGLRAGRNMGTESGRYVTNWRGDENIREREQPTAGSPPLEMQTNPKRGGGQQMLESEPLEQLLQALTYRNLMESIGVPLLEKLRAAKAPIDSKIYAASIRNAVNGAEAYPRMGSSQSKASAQHAEMGGYSNSHSSLSKAAAAAGGGGGGGGRR